MPLYKQKHTDIYGASPVMLGWLAPDCSLRTWFFDKDPKGDTTETKMGEVLTSEGLRTLPTSERTAHGIRAYGLDRATYDYVRSIMASNYAFFVHRGDAFKKTLITLANAKTSHGGDTKGYTFSGTYYTAPLTLVKN